MKHLKLFLNDIDYQNYVKSDDCIRPNVSYAEDTDTVYYNPYAESVSSYKMVDLGLPSGLKWADRNVGAASPEDSGLYFAWGETVGYTAEQIEAGEKLFNRSNYFDASGYTFTKYDKKKLTVLEAIDDAATVNMSSNWRMPTIDELNELYENATATFIDINGNEFSQSDAKNGSILVGNLKGVKLTGSNSNSIFIPAAGNYNEFNDLVYMGSTAYSWSSSLSIMDSYAYSLLYQYDGSSGWGSCERYHGRPVRGVCN